jgi:hypothetical protein
MAVWPQVDALELRPPGTSDGAVAEAGGCGHSEIS